MRYKILSLLFLVCACGDSTPDVDPPPLPRPRAPIAVVQDQMVLVGDVVTLSGESSSDPDGDLLQYTWNLRSRPALSHAELDGSSGSTVRFTADRAGVVVVDLVVSDSELESSPVTAVIGVLTTRDAPMAFAGPDRTVRRGAQVFVSGIGSRDPNGLPLLYDWTLISKPASSQVELTSNTTLTTHFSPDAVGAYEIELVAHNSGHASAPDRIVVTAVEPDVVIPGDVPNGVLNPDEVYIFGTLSEGLCGREAIAHWSDPNVATVGFECDADDVTAMVRNDGRLLYTNGFDDLREFHCDDCPTWAPGLPYPTNVLANDTILAIPPCAAAGISGFLVGITGERLHRCDGIWHDASGVPVPLTGELFSYGFNNKVLAEFAVIDIATGEQFPITGLSDGITLTTRVAGPTSFWMARYASDTVTLWRIDYTGVATLEGTYPAPPAGNHSALGGARLDGAGNLFQVGFVLTSFDEVIISRNLNGLSEVVYTEATNPAVQFHGSSLVTGP